MCQGTWHGTWKSGTKGILFFFSRLSSIFFFLEDWLSMLQYPIGRKWQCSPSSSSPSSSSAQDKLTRNSASLFQISRRENVISPAYVSRSYLLSNKLWLGEQHLMDTGLLSLFGKWSQETFWKGCIRTHCCHFLELDDDELQMCYHLNLLGSIFYSSLHLKSTLVSTDDL